MSFRPASIELFPVANNRRSITAAANTISLSFSRDPLIQWLRPNSQAWECLHNPSNKWQYRRVQRALYEGIVLQSASVSQLLKSAATPLKKDVQISPSGVANTIQGGYSVNHGNISFTESEDSGAVVILFPPKNLLRWNLRRIFWAFKIWFLDLWDPARDPETDELRLEKLLAAHETGFLKLRSQHKSSNLWYLEVIGIHPFLQSCGLGKRVMQQVFKYTENSCIALECTRESNIPFYEKLGFQVVDEVKLTCSSQATSEESDTVKYWLMIKD
ncbi:GNAT family N-acetyltransferase [Talaromyces proteolyticus]|uniref:GNAT family N-acetyltransferase n=1 Tax=Talaromyces proteolyticus TaxID=1131652 RepID=A0AAD4KTY8_9EURO|nr:GNAT family N-acetyltransferase [Talaromyces proteolyticus]KAH8698740.1 GNAT family N-acetyltransferase [Talaromyces proteolyticus]